MQRRMSGCRLAHPPVLSPLPPFSESKNLLIRLHFKPQFPFAISSLGLTTWKVAINDTHTHTQAPCPRKVCLYCSQDRMWVEVKSRPLLVIRGRAPQQKCKMLLHHFLVKHIYFSASSGVSLWKKKEEAQPLAASRHWGRHLLSFFVLFILSSVSRI